MRLRLGGPARGLLLLASVVWPGVVAACSRSEPDSRISPSVVSPSKPAEAHPAAGAERDASGFETARGSREWTFPRDHGAHPAYAMEWWYTTGILRTAEGRRFGYELTFFRVGLDSGAPSTRAATRPAEPVPEPGVVVQASDGPAERRVSPWRARDLILAHATLTDVDGGRFLVDHRASRATLGWAGADTAGLDVWVDEWRMARPAAGGSTGAVGSVGVGPPASPARAPAPPGEATAFTLAVPAASTGGRFGLDLRLESSRPPVLHGDGGLSPKDARALPHASWHLSLPRLETRGTLSVGSATFEVFGTTWMDHEFFTGGLADAQVGWDWFSARFEDGRDLMLYRLRRRDGSTDYLAGTVVAADGVTWRPADTRGATFELLERWTSPESRAVYPVAWRVRLPAELLDVVVRTPLAAQEVRSGGVMFDYWEGLVSYRGTWGDDEIRGEGYLEMTGYAAPLALR